MPTLYYCDQHEIPLPDGHKFPVTKYRLTRELLAGSGWTFEPAPFAGRETIERVHDADYVRQFLEGSLPAAAVRRIGFPWSRGLVNRTLASVGGTLMATRHAIEHGFGGNLAGGTHHAFRAEGSGFCVFNDIAIAILELREQNGIRRTAVVDLDVHQGDGTAQIFEDDPDVLTVSMHGRNNFPFRKQRSRIDVEFEDQTGDEEYLAKLSETLPRVFEFAPEVVFYQAGVDALETDRLGRLSLTAEGLRHRDRMVMEAVQRSGLPLVITQGGGYSQPIERTAEAHAATFETLLSIFGKE